MRRCTVWGRMASVRPRSRSITRFAPLDAAAILPGVPRAAAATVPHGNPGGGALGWLCGGFSGLADPPPHRLHSPQLSRILYRAARAA